ncbi:hypothetical protein ACIBG0_41795 [Nocardia sp. NPDC050630]|uniref:hypothetical protein n=1 Tax=Nocardia sp. NPDC050630 TaxID=3364321 RepID=UPI0037A75F5F
MTTPAIDDTSTDQPRTPHTEPNRDTGDRCVTAIWTLTDPDSDGWQASAELTATHIAGMGYVVRLRADRKQHDGPFVRILFDHKTITVTEITRTAGKPRFHRTTLNKVFEEGLEELRRRFDANDSVVRAYFDPTSERHTR